MTESMKLKYTRKRARDIVLKGMQSLTYRNTGPQVLVKIDTVTMDVFRFVPTKYLPKSQRKITCGSCGKNRFHNAGKYVFYGEDITEDNPDFFCNDCVDMIMKA